VQPSRRCSKRSVASGGLPEQITVDNGTEFFSQAMDRWAYGAGVKLDFIRPGRPTENGYIEKLQRQAARRMPQWRAILGLG
jgi:transposase InsO family protein